MTTFESMDYFLGKFIKTDHRRESLNQSDATEETEKSCQEKKSNKSIISSYMKDS